MIKCVFGVWVVPLVSLPVFFYCTGNNCCFWDPMSQSIYYTICVCACAMCVVWVCACVSALVVSSCRNQCEFKTFEVRAFVQTHFSFFKRAVWSFFFPPLV